MRFHRIHPRMRQRHLHQRSRIIAPLATIIVLLLAREARADMAMPDMQGMSGMAQAPKSTPTAFPKPRKSDKAMSMQPAMSAITNLSDPMSREGSGTSWMPDSTQTFGFMQMHANGSVSMEHFAVFPRYVDDGSNRGGRRIDAPNWFMGMQSIPLSPTAQLGVRAMVSLDFLTENGFGYPLLFQTGETWHGQSLHDAQHPHDLFSELSTTYSTRLGNKSSAYMYLGYPGEPALGPPTFMHRRIAYDMADAPIGHHWQDATHVTFGVATVGVTHGNAKIEGSTFTGREPNEIRTNFDPIHLDSYSTRISWNAGKNLATQMSEGYIQSPEYLTPNINIHRSTASIIYNHALALDKNMYIALVYGQNDESTQIRTNSYLAEFDFQNRRNTYFGRFERVGKTASDLIVPAFNLDQVYELTQATIGYVKELSHHSYGTQTGIGAQFTRSFMPTPLGIYYGETAPPSFEIFFRLRPSEISPTAMNSTMNSSNIR